MQESAQIAGVHRQPNSALDSPLARGLARLFRSIAAHLAAFWRRGLHHAARPQKKLAIRETAALGDRRFISVVQFERQRFLIASSSSSISLLAKLSDDDSPQGAGKDKYEEHNQKANRVRE